MPDTPLSPRDTAPAEEPGRRSPRPASPAAGTCPAPFRIAVRAPRIEYHGDRFVKHAGPPLEFSRTHPAVHVWTIRLHDGAVDAAGWDLLSPAEKERARRFVFPQHRNRYTQAHLALRRVLAGCLGASADELAIGDGPLGKPELAAPHDRLRFNLSHAQDYAMVAVMRSDWGDVGIDVESLDQAARRAAELAPVVLDSSERSMLDSLPGADRGAAFITAWTRKEAVLKATGWGLRIPPDTLHTGVSPDAANATLPGNPAIRSQVRVLPLAAPPGHVASIAILPPSAAASAAQPKAVPHA